MKTGINVRQFFERFPDDDSCLAHLMLIKYGEKNICQNCDKKSKFHKIKGQPVYSCQWCGWHIHPMVGTPFEATRTPLQKWFYAMYLFTTSRHGVAAKELQRQLGITYKTAWRMAHEIRKYMGDVDGEHMLGGQVEVDETLIGGVKHTGKPGPYLANKASVFGMVKRGGSVITKVIPNRSAKTLLPLIEKGIHVGTTINTDDWLGYQNIPINYTHVSVNHSKKEYVRGSVHTNTIEGFWSRVKNSIKGTHIHVSKKHLQKYLVEFEYRYNMRATPERMFERLLTSFVWVASR